MFSVWFRSRSSIIPIKKVPGYITANYYVAVFFSHKIQPDFTYRVTHKGWDSETIVRNLYCLYPHIYDLRLNVALETSY